MVVPVSREFDYLADAPGKCLHSPNWSMPSPLSPKAMKKYFRVAASLYAEHETAALKYLQA